MKETVTFCVFLGLLLFGDIYSLIHYSWLKLWNICLNLCIFWTVVIVWDIKGDQIYKELHHWWHTGRSKNIHKMEEGRGDHRKVIVDHTCSGQTSGEYIDKEHPWMVI
tara:strand:+ start:192 stop:515 length:324 start_codon:yes stop_codon:yes gene_type:complete